MEKSNSNGHPYLYENYLEVKKGFCNQLSTNLLVSDALKTQLPENDYLFIPKEEFELRGRNKHEELFEVRSTNNG